jgi:hypothetical protein
MFAPVRRRTYLLPTEPSASAVSSGTGVITFVMG